MSKAAPAKATETKAPAAPAAHVRDKNIDLALTLDHARSSAKARSAASGRNAKMKIGELSTGSLAIDLALGVGGLPRGRIMEIYGPESSGKTTFCLSAIAEAQSKGGSLLHRRRHALDPKYARVVGGSSTILLVAPAATAGRTRSTSRRRLIRSNSIDVIDLDSVPR